MSMAFFKAAFFFFKQITFSKTTMHKVPGLTTVAYASQTILVPRVDLSQILVSKTAPCFVQFSELMVNVRRLIPAMDPFPGISPSSQKRTVREFRGNCGRASNK